MMLATTQWLDDLTTANATTRAFLFYSLAAIAIGLYSVISSALFSPDIKLDGRSQDLREEPPAVVNLLVNDLNISTDAPTAVLLHLARRGYITITNSDDGIETVALNIREAPDVLKTYETRVLDLVRAAMTAGREYGPITVSALHEYYSHDTDELGKWWDDFQHSVAEEALALKLVVRRCSAVMVRILRVCAVVLVCVGILSLGRSHSPHAADPQSWSVGIFSVSTLLTFVALSRLDQKELRYTRYGSDTTTAWLSTRSTMQHVGSFADLGPSAVNIWGDRMYYATAVGVARETSRRLTLVTGDGAEAWYIMNQRWHHTRAAIPKVYGWGGSPWKHLADSALPFFVSSAALGSVGAIVWFGKIGHGDSNKAGLQGAINRMLHFPQRLSFAELPQVLALAVFAGLLWVLRGQIRRATPIYHAVLDLFLLRHEHGVIAYDQDGWIGIGNPHSRSMTLYRLPDGLDIDRSTHVELVATRFFGRVKRIRPLEPPRPRKPAFS